MVKFDNLPSCMQNDEVKKYYDILEKKKVSLFLKRVFDIVVSAIMLIFLIIPIAIIALMIKLDSPGKVIFKQERITKYGRKFYIYKFRTMVENAEKLGTQVTVDNDPRITRIGKKLRKLRLDELTQVFNILKGDMSFVGTRPEVKKYVDKYDDEMYATLLLPAGVTSLASIYYKDEDKLLEGAYDTDKVYVEEVLPSKMYYNLKSIENFSFLSDIITMFKTVFAVLGKEYKVDLPVDQEQTAEKEVMKK